MEDTCTTNFKILCKGQDIVDLFASWSNVNRVQLNIAKCKELCISIFKTDNDFSLTVGESTIKVVDSTNLLGLNITNDLMWNALISETIRKVGKWLYSHVQLKRASVSRKDVSFLFLREYAGF